MRVNLNHVKLRDQFTYTYSELMRWIFTWLIIGITLFSLFMHRAWFIPETDYVAYYKAGERALNGTNLYESDATPFKYFPVVSYFFIPLSLIPFQLSKVIFFLVNFISGLLIYILIYRKWNEKCGMWMALISLFSFIRFHNYDFLNSQLNHILLLILLFYLDLRRSHPIIASFLFSIMASFKIMPLLTLAPLLFMKKFKEIGWIIATFFVLCLIPVLTFRDGIQLYSNWFYLMLDTTEFPAPSGAIVQSVQAALWYWLGPILPKVDYFILLSSFIQIFLLGIVCFFASQSTTPDDEQRVLNAAIVLSTIISPLAWKHNYLLILPSFVILLQREQFLTAGIVSFLMTLSPTFLSIYSGYYSDRSYLTLFGALGVFFSLFIGFKVRSPMKYSDKVSESVAQPYLWCKISTYFRVHDKFPFLK